MKENAECEGLLCVDAYVHYTVELSGYEYVMAPSGKTMVWGNA